MGYLTSFQLLTLREPGRLFTSSNTLTHSWHWSRLAYPWFLELPSCAQVLYRDTADVAATCDADLSSECQLESNCSNLWSSSLLTHLKKQRKMALGLGPLLPTWGTWMKLLAPGLRLAQPRLLWCFGEWIRRWQIPSHLCKLSHLPSIPTSLHFLFNSAFQIETKSFKF